MHCPRCGGANPDNKRFCGDCGSAFGLLATGPEAPAGMAERRQVTALFCDLVGSTELASRIDPEDFREVIAGYHRAVGEAVAGFGGSVVVTAGDGALATFGFPAAHEDDPERAVHAALAAREAVGRLQLLAGYAARVRIGIATGLVIAGDIVGRAHAPRQDVAGDTPNLAARLQAAAAPGEILLSDATRALLGQLFQLEDLGGTALRGFATPVRAWRLLGKRHAPDRFRALRPAGNAPLVGRQAELARLLGFWRAAQAGAGAAVLLSGEPGIGKSRTVAALVETIGAAPADRLRYFGSPYHRGSAFWPILRQIERSAGLNRETDPAARTAGLAGFLAGIGVDAASTALLAEMLELPPPAGPATPALTPQGKRQLVQEAMLEAVAGYARRRPLLMLVEDAHWADPSTIGMFQALVSRIAELPILLVVTARPEFSAPWAGLAGTHALRLGRLGRPEAQAILDRLVGAKPLPPELAREIIDRSDGIPLFLEEMTRAVLETGAVVEQADRFVLAGPLPALGVPSSLQASLMARLDRLGPARELAQIASVIGRDFGAPLLAAVAGRSAAELRPELEALLASGLVVARAAGDWRFRHALVRDAAYGALLRGRRQLLHARIAEWLEAAAVDSAAGNLPKGGGLRGEAAGGEPATPEVLAHHFTEAGLPARAIAWWTRAGKQAEARSAMLEAQDHYRRGLLLLPQLPDGLERRQHELVLQLGLGTALIASSGYTAPGTGAVFARARALAEQLGDLANLLRVTNGEWSFHLMRAAPEDAMAVARDLLQRAGPAPGTAAERGADRVADLRLAGHRLVGASLLQIGELAAAERHLELAAELLADPTAPLRDLSGRREAEVAVPAYRAIVLGLLGRYGAARAANAAAVAAAERSGRPHRLAFALGVASWFHGILGEEAVALRDAFARLSEEREFPFWTAFALGFRGLTLARQGQPEAGLALVREETARHLAMGARWGPQFFQGSIAPFIGGAEGARLLADAMAVAERDGVVWLMPELHRINAALLRETAGPEALAAAMSGLHAAIGTARAQGARHWELRASLDLARMWCAEGRGGEAAAMLAELLVSFAAEDQAPDLETARALRRQQLLLS